MHIYPTLIIWTTIGQVETFYNTKFTITGVGVYSKCDLLDYINDDFLPLRTNVMWEMNRSAKLAEYLSDHVLK